jgi:DNA repair exonuclease SbcCD ATPase subunit
MYPILIKLQVKFELLHTNEQNTINQLPDMVPSRPDMTAIPLISFYIPICAFKSSHTCHLHFHYLAHKKQKERKCLNTMSPKEVIDLTQAIGNLTTATSAVSDAAKKLEEWSRQLDEKDARLKQTEERLNVKDRELEDKEKRLKGVEERMKVYEVVVKKLEENAAKLGPVVKLNVGKPLLSSLTSFL